MYILCMFVHVRFMASDVTLKSLLLRRLETQYICHLHGQVIATGFLLGSLRCQFLIDLNSHCEWDTYACWFQTELPRSGKMFPCYYNLSWLKSITNELYELSSSPMIQAYSSQIQAIHQIKHELRSSSPRLPVDRVTFFASASLMLACGAVAPLGLKDCGVLDQLSKYFKAGRDRQGTTKNH